MTILLLGKTCIDKSEDNPSGHRYVRKNLQIPQQRIFRFDLLGRMLLVWLCCLLYRVNEKSYKH